MADEQETPDVYSDQFRISTSPYGATLVFAKTQADQPVGQPARTKDQVIVRMSLEHLKVMIMVLRKNLKGHEQRTGVSVELPFDMLNSLGLSKEDW
ncbi:MAG: hypothetical protein ACRDFW_14225 [bacterium]